MNHVLNKLHIEQHPDKTLIGRQERGFDFLGYHFKPDGCQLPVRVSKKSWSVSPGFMSKVRVLIAGSAKTNKCALVTANIHHFSRIRDLVVENWPEAV